MTTDGYLSIKQYAERNKVGIAKVRSALTSGKLKNCIFRNRHWMIPATASLNEKDSFLPVPDASKSKSGTFKALRNKIYKGEANGEEIAHFTNMVLELKTAGATMVLDGNVYTLQEIESITTSIASNQDKLAKLKTELDERTGKINEKESSLSIKEQTLNVKENILNKLLDKSGQVKQWCYESVAKITSASGKIDLPEFPIDPKDLEAWNVLHKEENPDDKEYEADGIEG